MLPDSDFFNPLFWGLICCFSDIFAQAKVRPYFKHIYVVLSFLDCPGKLLLCGKSE